MKQRVFNLIILDESGSMICIKKPAIDGVNETVQTIRAAQKKHPEQEHYVSLVTFNSSNIKYVFENMAADRVEELTPAQYEPACGTPLYDAMGNALTRLRHNVAEADVVLVTIITDGYENDSTEYNQATIKALVEDLKSHKWIFTYIGANQDVVSVAKTISVQNTLCFNTDEKGTEAMFSNENKSRTRFFDRLSSNASMDDLMTDYFDQN